MTAAKNPGAAGLGGKHAVVTGGARGIGAAVARDAVASRRRVTITGRSADAGPEALAEMKQVGEIDYVQADVTDASAVKQAFEQAIAAASVRSPFW